MQQPTFHWHILGAGSLGLLFAYYLAKAGHSVTLLGRQKNHQKLPVNACINNTWQQQTITLSHSEYCQGIDLLLVTVKAQDTHKALSEVAHKLTNNSQVFLLQNGLGQLPCPAIAEHLQLIPAITQAGAQKTDTLSVHVHAKGETFIPWLSKQQRNQKPWRCELPVTPTMQFQQMQWQKLAVNAVINPLTAIHDCRNGDILQLPSFIATAQTIIDELIIVADAKAINLNKNQLLQTVCDVARKTAGNSSSMREDIRHKKITEIDFINGYIVSQAKQLGLNTPYNLMLLQRIKKLQGY